MNGGGHPHHPRQQLSPQHSQRHYPEPQRQPQPSYTSPKHSYTSSQDAGYNMDRPQRGMDSRGIAAGERDFMQWNPFLVAGQDNIPLPSAHHEPPEGRRVPIPEALVPPGGPSSGTYPNFSVPQGMGMGGMSSTPPDNSSQNKKKKRRPGESPSAAAATEEKRTKTGRACDACRSKKIRCDILQTEDEGQPICAHCKQYNIECTFFLPITETRFKKRRQAETAASPATKPVVASTSNGAESKTPGGPASILSLVHSSLPVRSFEQFHIANHAYWQVSEDENGRIKVEAQTEHPDEGGDSAAQRLAKYVLPGPMMTALVNSYFEHDNTYLPIIDRAQFIKDGKPYPLLLYAMCAATATRREFPRHVFQRLRGLVNGLLRANEIMSHATIEHIQALLLCTTNGEMNAQPTAPTASAANLRLGVACRMGQDLGLHREQAGEQPRTKEAIEARELRRRLWAALMTYDAWYCGALALPMVLNALDCDVPLPSPYRITAAGKSEFDVTYACIGEKLKLSMLLARIFRLMYGPTGLNRATDNDLKSILDDLNAWHQGLPDPLKFTGNNSNMLAGMLQMLFTTVQFLFWRGWLRVQHPPPSHLKLILDGGRWHQLVQWSRDSIEWLNANDYVLDQLFVFPYTATSCALVQYHMWARKRDPAALETLKLVRDIVARWEEMLQPDQMSTRRKSCETMMLLYEAALKTLPDDEWRTERSDGTPGSSVSRSGTEGGTAPAFGKRSQAHAQSAQQSRYLERLEGDGPHVVTYSSEANSNTRAELTSLDDPSYDVSFLDNLPESNFDWNAWGQYFETVDRIFANNEAGEGDSASAALGETMDTEGS